ncbi:MAG: hypothetical protein JKY53_14365 [Flavobacteriales bacterium]|nr:hypothetical protein [Flavobacteriales bacterium]
MKFRKAEIHILSFYHSIILPFHHYTIPSFVLVKGIFVISCLFFTTSLSAQSSEPFIDSIKTSFSYTPKLVLRADARTSFITNKPARIFGIKLGLNFNDRVQIGLGYNWLISDIKKDRRIVIEGKVEKVDSRLVLQYVSPYFEYTYYNSPKLELSIPVMIGLGYSRYTAESSFYQFVPDTENKFVLFYEPYSVGLYKPIPWVGVGFGVGYRLVFIGNNSLAENLNSPIYVFKVKLLAGFFSRP